MGNLVAAIADALPLLTPAEQAEWDLALERRERARAQRAFGDLVVEQDTGASLFGEAGTAWFSPDGQYRYRLDRRWSDAAPLLIVMLNPSTADAFVNDPTIVRCVRYARRWGAGGLTVLNLFALRSTDPRALRQHADPIGPANDLAIADALDTVTEYACVAAWGSHGNLHGRGRAVARMLREHRGASGVYCLATTKDGHPGHPLYLRSDTVLARFDGYRS